jgi:hypothetical protein
LVPPLRLEVLRAGRLMIVGSTVVRELGDSLAWVAGMEVDVDGAPEAYAPAGVKALDDLRNAGGPGDWYGLVCNPYGTPYVQGADDPFPGGYVSGTSLVDHSRAAWDVRRYVDASMVPYLSLPKELFERAGARVGQLAMACYGDAVSAAIVAEEGPHGRIGEGSLRLVQALGVDPFRGLPQHHLLGIDSGVRCVVFFGSVASPAWPRNVAEFSATAAGLFKVWGGSDRLLAV